MNSTNSILSGTYCAKWDELSEETRRDAIIITSEVGLAQDRASHSGKD